MKIRQIERVVEKDMIVSMITDKNYLSIISSKLNINLLKNKYSKTIIKWIMDYFSEYGECPKNEIEKIFEYNKSVGFFANDEHSLEMIERVLIEASEKLEYNEVPNTRFMLDKSEDYLNTCQLENTFSTAQDLWHNGRITEANDLVCKTVPITFGGGYATDGLTDEDKIRMAFEEKAEPLMSFGGDFGKMVDEHLCRDSLVAFQAAPKTGKTFMLLECAKKALESRLKVVFFQMGDMTENQTHRRLSVMFSGRSDNPKYCGVFSQPVRFLKSEMEDGAVNYSVETEEVEVKPLGWGDALKANTRFFNRNRLKQGKNWRMVTVPAKTMNVSEIKAELERLEKQEEFVADVIIVDYMDILGDEPGVTQGASLQDKIDANWVAMKALSNERHILVITATQANSASFSGEVQTKANFSDSSKKSRHVNAMFGLSSSPIQRKQGVLCVNPLFLREGEGNERDVCYLLQCLRRGQVIKDSLMPGFMDKGALFNGEESTSQSTIKPGEKKEIKKMEKITPTESVRGRSRNERRG